MTRESGMEGGRGFRRAERVGGGRGSVYWARRVGEAWRVVRVRVRRAGGRAVKISVARYCGVGRGFVSFGMEGSGGWWKRPGGVGVG